MKISSPLGLFIMVSITIHAAVVMHSSNTTTITLPSAKGSNISIKIKEITVKAEKVKESKNNLKPKHHKVLNTATLNPPAVTTSTDTPNLQKNTEQKKTEKTATLAAEKNVAISKARVISVIYEELSQHFTYPRLAQKRNWQGKVLLSLRVKANGNIENVQLKHSSGYNVLDKAAIRSLLRVKTLPKISSWLSGDINLNLPVIYQLTEG